MSRWVIHAEASFAARHALTSYRGAVEASHEHAWKVAARVGTDDLREVRVLVTVPVSYLARQPPTATTFPMIVTDLASRHSNERTTHFQR